MDISPSIIQTVAIVGGAFAIIYSQFLSNNKNGAKDLIDILTKTNEEQKSQISDYQVKIDSLTRDLSRLEGVVGEKDKKLQDYIDIFKGISPDEEKYRADMRNFTVGVASYMAETVKTLTENTKLLTEMSVFIHNINNKLTDSSVVV